MHPWRIWFLSIHLAIVVLAIYLLPAAMSQKVFNQDSRQHVAYMAVFQDSELFVNDWVKGYFFDAFAPPGYKAYLAVVARWLDPQVAAELLGMLLAGLSAWLAYRIGAQVTQGNPIGGLAGLIVYLTAGNIAFDMHFIRWVQGGLQRSFVVPCFFVGMLGLLARRDSWLASATVIAAFFYPPTCIMLGAIWLFALLFRWWNERRVVLREWLWFTAGNSVALLVLILSRPSHWTTYTLREALEMPDFFDRALAIDSNLHHNLWPYLRELVPFPAPAIGLLAGLIIVVIVRRRRDFPWQVFFSIILGSWATYGLAYALFNRLYEPSRYLFPLRCLWLLVVPIIVVDVTSKLKMSRNVLGWATVIWCMATTLGASYLVHRRIERHEGGVTAVLPAAAYDFLAMTPKSTLIAGYPKDVGDIPLLARRRVLLLSECLYPCHKEFYDEAKSRFVDVLRALWAPDLDGAIALRGKYGVDLLVVTRVRRDDDVYAATTIFANVYRELAERLGNREPAILHPPANSVVFATENCQIIDLNRLKR